MSLFFQDSLIGFTWNEWNCKLMIDPMGDVSCHVSSESLGYELG